MDPTQNQSGTPGPIFSAGPGPEEPPMTPAPSGSGNIVFQPNNDYYSAAGGNTRSKKPLIIGVIAVVAIIVILLIVLPILSNGGEKPVDESKVKPAVYSYINYLVYGEESDSYKDISVDEVTKNAVYSKDIQYLPLHADSMIFSSNKNEYLDNLNKKLEDLAVTYEETYDAGMDFENLRLFYHELALVINDPWTDVLDQYTKNGVEGIEALSDITTSSKNENVIKYVEDSNQLRKLYINFFKEVNDAGCNINEGTNNGTLSLTTQECIANITLDDSTGTLLSGMNQIEQNLRANAMNDLSAIINKFYSEGTK